MKEKVFSPFVVLEPGPAVHDKQKNMNKVKNKTNRPEYG
jgi:hypothetical protein